MDAMNKRMLANKAREVAKLLELDADRIDPMSVQEVADKAAFRAAATGWGYFAHSLEREIGGTSITRLGHPG